MSRNGWLHLKVGFLSVSRLILCYCWEYKILTMLQAVMVEASPLLLCCSFQKDLSKICPRSGPKLQSISLSHFPWISVCFGAALAIQFPWVIATACSTSKETPQMSCPMIYSLHTFADFVFAAEVQNTFFFCVSRHWRYTGHVSLNMFFLNACEFCVNILSAGDSHCISESGINCGNVA